ncbi:MAG: hypothetical protein ABWY27_16845 [Telluria sp.]
MTQKSRSKDPAATRPLLDEADIGSGEKTPGQKETEEFIRQIPPLPPTGKPDDARQPPSQ